MQLSAGIGLIGCGTVGANVARLLLARQSEIEAQTGMRYEIRAIAVRSLERERGEIPQHLLTSDARAVACDPNIDILIECAGGTGEMAGLVETALERGAQVITANKDLVATQGPRLRAIAAACGARLSYEAAVCAAIPIVGVLAHALAGDEILSLAGVMNGTTNAILCAMEHGSDYAQALAQAQHRGYAEADPSSDVDGHDAAHKLAVLAQLAFGCSITSPQIARRGIAGIGPRDIARARTQGQRIRLIAAARKTARGIMAEVAPVFVCQAHPFAQTSDAQNALRIVARNAGTLSFVGAGAGGEATASAVLGDVIEALRAISDRRSAPRRMPKLAQVEVEPFPSLEALVNVFEEPSLALEDRLRA